MQMWRCRRSVINFQAKEAPVIRRISSFASINAYVEKGEGRLATAISIKYIQSYFLNRVRKAFGDLRRNVSTILLRYLTLARRLSFCRNSVMSALTSFGIFCTIKVLETSWTHGSHS